MPNEAISDEIIPRGSKRKMRDSDINAAKEKRNEQDTKNKTDNR